MTEPSKSSWTMGRFLDEEFGPPMLLRVARAIQEAQAITEALGSSEETPPLRNRLRALIEQIDETAVLHHWLEEGDILAELVELALGEAPADTLRRPLRAALYQLEVRLQARLVNTVTQNWRRETKS